ncbi:MAG: PilZ domain-containing protein [Lachnospiraceae bacterium]|nr:PilZ domain-containing protein [Lachnospiraceae bacterium]
MPKIVFETGNKVNLTLIKRGNIFSVKPVEDTVYSCSILHVISEKQLVISVPLIGNTLLSMTVNDIYSIQFFTKHGLYQSKCVVSEKGKDGHIATVTVKLISNLERNQRREYFRLDCRIGLKWAKLTETQVKLYNDLKNAVTDGRKRIIKEQLKMEEITYGNALMMDISGGGMRFNSTAELEKDDTLLLIPDIPDIVTSIPYLMGRVVLTRPLEAKNASYENKIKFINISSEEREKIITYIFAVEREKMRTD